MGSSVKHIAQLIKPISVKFKKGLTLFDVYEVRTGIFISTLKLGTNGFTCLLSKAGVIKKVLSINFRYKFGSFECQVDAFLFSRIPH